MNTHIVKKLIPLYCIILAIALFATHLINKTAKYVSKTAPSSTAVTVIIDPGHGLPDGGATSCTGVLESDLNLEISLRLNDLFHLFGIKTILVRTGQDSIYTEGESIAKKKISDVRNRVSLVNNTDNAILLSIHQNHFYESQYSGAQVFYAKTKESKQLAEKLQADLIANLNPNSNRAAKKSSGVFLMEHINCTGVLIECGFLSNLQEESLLRSPQYQKELCSIIAISCHSFLNQQTAS